MLKIEIKGKGIDKRLTVNGITDEESMCDDDDESDAYLYSEEVIDILLNNSFEEVGVFLHNFHFELRKSWWDDNLSVDIFCNEYHNEYFPSIKVTLELQAWEHWSKPWSISNFNQKLKENIENLNNLNVVYWQNDKESLLNGFGIQYFLDDHNLIIKTEFDYYISFIEQIIERTNKDLLGSLNSDSFITFFTFPQEIKTACKQYLVYFAQFLMDIGIEVDTEIKEEEYNTLFRVTPMNKNESLSKIKDALQVYLNAPEFDSLNMSAENDVAIMQWQANIMHLKSQLTLSNSILQLKEATIQSLQLSNYQYQQLILDKESKNKSTEEDVIKGIVSIKKYDGNWFSVNFAEIIRRLKRKLNN